MSDDRRADIEAKQQAVATVLRELDAEGMLLLLPAHVAWFTSGLSARGLIADSERPGVYTDGRQRWLVCSNVDTQRLFDEELDGLGFQLREWHWQVGRADMLAQMTAGKKIVADRPFPNIPLVNDRLRPLLRRLSAYEQRRLVELGRRLAHAVEATGRNCRRGESEQEVAGQLGHRLLRHGVEPVALSVTADGHGSTYRRTGFGPRPVTTSVVIQATGQLEGLYATCARVVSFGPPPTDFRLAHDLAARQAAVCRALTRPGAGIVDIATVARGVLGPGPYEFDWRLSPPGYATGRFPAEELRRGGVEDPLDAGYAVVWQARVGPSAVVDTLIVTADAPLTVTPPEDWPVKRITVRDGPSQDFPDVLVRDPH